MSETARQLLVGQGLSKVYRRRCALDAVTVEVGKGETVGLLGPNGAGKTTSFYILAGLVRPTSGTVLFDGKDITALPVDRRARMGIGFLPQERSVFRMLSVLDNVKAVLEIRGEPPRDIEDRALEFLTKMGVVHLAKEKVGSLSGGELRRVEIARALVLKPRVLMLDEPFAAIDPLTVSDLQGMLRKLRDDGISIVISDHNVRETLEICDKGYILHDGRLLCGGTPKELAANAQVRTHYLGADFTL